MKSLPALLAGVALIGAAAAQADQDSQPPSSDAVLHATFTPDSLPCADDTAFGVKLGQPIEASAVRVTVRDRHWAGNVKVSEYQPEQPLPPYARFIYMDQLGRERPVSWVIGVLYFADERLADDELRVLTHVYEMQADQPLRDALDTSAIVRLPRQRLMLIRDGRSLRVSCERDLPRPPPPANTAAVPTQVTARPGESASAAYLRTAQQIVMSSVRYPQKAMSNGETGTAIVSYTVAVTAASATSAWCSPAATSRSTARRCASSTASCRRCRMTPGPASSRSP